MTREEAKKFEWFRHDRNEIERHIDKIYNDFESRICENCKFIEKAENGDMYKCNILMSITKKEATELINSNFGCNRFILKDRKCITK